MEGERGRGGREEKGREGKWREGERGRWEKAWNERGSGTEGAKEEKNEG